MPRRAVSPAASENEVDILGSLFATDDATGTNEKGEKAAVQNGFSFDAGDFLDGIGNNGHGGEDDQDDETFIALKQAASFRKASNLTGKTVKKGGGFQAMGLNPNLLRAITRKGFSVPTPIQRKVIPLIMAKKDVVGMARTGSGKTAAFVIPMIERLKAHKATIGARALILSPSRELALQTLKTVKEFSRGTDLRTILLVGGDSLEEQFGAMSANPDIIVATPGRFLHLKVEMSLELAIEYAVFDEVDRLMEQGFAPQMNEILASLPTYRQTLLFSATLPASLVEFARAGLQEPTLVRLDAESKISPELQSAFFSVKGSEKEGVLLHILQDIIKIPTGLPEGAEAESDKPSKKRKRESDMPPRGRGKPTEHSTIIFTATQHHCQYLQSLLEVAGYAVSYVYGSLDQTARKNQVENFRRGRSHILVVTDVAARGIDIPMLSNVVNYDFCPQPKIFVHRVGRTARAGQKGWSYSLVRDSDAPYLIDLQLFLGKKLIVGDEGKGMTNFAEDMVVGSPVRSKVETNVEWLNKVLGEIEDLNVLRRVAEKAEKLYLRTRNSASSQSARRAKEIVASKGWMQVHPIFGEELGDAENARAEMLAKISGFKPQETIFEIGRTGKPGKSSRNDAAEVMKSLRERFGPRRTGKEDEKEAEGPDGSSSDVEINDAGGFGEEEDEDMADGDNIHSDAEEKEQYNEDEDESDLEVTISNNATGKRNKKSSSQDPSSWQDSEVFMSYTPRTVNAAEERGYSVNSGSANFVEAARDATMDLANDEGAKSFGVPARARMRWDKKAAKYVSRDNDEDGSRGGPRLVRGESGVKIAASFQSGRFERWKKAQRLGRMPRVGEQEKRGSSGGGGGGGTAVIEGGRAAGARYRHKQEKAPREADKYRDDYHGRKKRVAEAREKRVGRFRDGAGSRKEIKSADDIRKARKIQEQRRAKNARPARR